MSLIQAILSEVPLHLYICTFADDRVSDYQHYAIDAVQSCAADSPDMGAQVLH